MKLFITTLILALILSLSLTAQAASADQVVCVRNAAPVNQNNRVRIARAIHLRDGQCRRNEKQIAIQHSPQSKLDMIKTVDGSGSGLDADLLDGMDSSSFALASSFNELEDEVSLNAASITQATQDLSTAENNIMTLFASAQALEEGLQNVQLGENIVRVGFGSQFSDISSAITYVESQNPAYDNPFQILVGPGVYELSSTVTVPTYTELKGSGSRSTILEGDGDTNPVVIVDPGGVLSDLGVRSTNTNNVQMALIRTSIGNTATRPHPASVYQTIRRVRAEYEESKPAGLTYGIWAVQTDCKIEDSEIYMENQDAGNTVGIMHDGSGDLYVINTQVSSNSTGSGLGIIGNSTNSLTITNSNVAGSAQGLNSSGGPITVANSIISSDDIAIVSNLNSTVSVASSIIDAPISYEENDTSTVTCAFVSDKSASEIDCNI